MCNKRNVILFLALIITAWVMQFPNQQSNESLLFFVLNIFNVLIVLFVFYVL